VVNSIACRAHTLELHSTKAIVSDAEYENRWGDATYGEYVLLDVLAREGSAGGWGGPGLYLPVALDGTKGTAGCAEVRLDGLALKW